MTSFNYTDGILLAKSIEARVRTTPMLDYSMAG